MNRFKLLYFVIFIINLFGTNAQISDKRLCVDKECKVPISEARTLLKYSSPDSRILSFGPSELVTIYSKSAGSREDLWGVEIKGKRGYVPKRMLRETKVLQKPTLLVDTELGNATDTLQVPSQVGPDKVQEPYEVVEGTTIYSSPQGEINPSTTDSTLQPTASPVDTNKFHEIQAEEVINSSSNTQENAGKRIENTEEIENENGGIKTEMNSEAAEEKVVKDTVEASPNLAAEHLTETVKNNDNVIKEQLDQSLADGAILTQTPEHINHVESVKDTVKASLNLTAEHLTETVKNNDNVVKLDQASDHAILTQTPEHINQPVPETVQLEPVSTQPNSQIVEEINTEPVSVLTLDPVQPLNVPKPDEIRSETNQQVDGPVPDITGDELITVDTDKLGEDSAAQSINEIANAETIAQLDENASTVTPAVDVTPNSVEQEAVAVKDTTLSPLGLFSSEHLQHTNLKQDLTIGEGVLTATSEQSAEKTTDSEYSAKNKDFLSGSKDVSGDLKDFIHATKDAVVENKDTVDEIEHSANANEQLGEESIDLANDKEDVLKENKDSVNETLVLVNENSYAGNKIEDAENENKDSANEIKDSVIESKDSANESLVSASENNYADNENKYSASDSEDSGNESLDSGSEIKDTTNENNDLTDENKNSFDKIKDSAHGSEDLDESRDINAEPVVEPPGVLSGLLSFFTFEPEQAVDVAEPAFEHTHKSDFEDHQRDESTGPFRDSTTCDKSEPDQESMMELFAFNPDVLLYLVTTAISVIVFLFGYIAFDKNKRVAPLIAKINKLEKDLLVLVKENQILQEKLSSESGYETNDKVPNEEYERLKLEFDQLALVKLALEEQVQSLEKELENSTEVGMELNRMLTEILSSESGSDVLKANVEHLQRQLVEQQSTVNSVNESLAVSNTENHELRLELELNRKKVVELQAQLDKLLANVLKIEEEKEEQQSSLESEIATHKLKHQEMTSLLKTREDQYNNELLHLKNRIEQAERKAELKEKEHAIITESIKQLKAVKNNNELFEKLSDASGAKAELQVLQNENKKYRERLANDEELRASYEKRAQASNDEIRLLKEKYDEVDKSRLEAQTKLEVLSNYFKDREAQWQKEISKHEALWAEKEGEATSSTQRIRFMQEQLQIYKDQTESLKQEIMSQEIELKSQISVLEKKAHENWVNARHAERKLEETKQEAAQLRHRLTLRERALQDDKNQQRLQSPMEQNGDVPVSPLEPTASPLIFGVRDHLTKSPPIPGLPPFLPPPPGAPFMPPPLPGVPPFMPPPANFFPDHRPPPLGRMSSPPLNSRYSPSSRGYSPYDHGSSSPSDSEYGTSPPHRRAYSPFRDERRDYKRPPPRTNNGRNVKGGSSGNSNESLEKINRQQSKV